MTWAFLYLSNFLIWENSLFKAWEWVKGLTELWEKFWEALIVNRFWLSKSIKKKQIDEKLK